MASTDPHRSKPFLDWPAPIAFAHRGGAGDWPENTMPAFAGAVALGYRYVETDVHVTSDGVLLAFHDDHLDRVTDGTGAISDLPYAEVRTTLVDGREPIPRLDELLDAWPELRINIDAKHDEAVEPLAEVIEKANAIDRVCVASFSDTRLTRLRQRLGPDLCTAFGSRAVARLRSASFGIPAGRFFGDCMQVPTGRGRVVITDERFVRAAHRRGLAVHVWTIDDADEMHRLLDLGVDGIMTDRPSVLKDVLLERDCWAQ
jgi:glycerophosphoryl diester phosphodiesterase